MWAEIWNDVRYRVRALIRRDAADRDLNAEIADHLEREAAALVRAGWSPWEARREARLAFGCLEQVKASTRDAWGTALITSAIQDTRFGLRQLRRNPLFACS